MSNNALHIIGIPMDLGQSRRGVDMGPSAIRYANLQEGLHRLGYHINDYGNINVLQAEQISEQTDITNAHHLREVSEICTRIADYAGNLNQQEPVIFLGGDHSISIGTIAVMAKQQNIGVLWIDAHADMNTPQTSPSGNIHGMSVAALLGHGPTKLTAIADNAPILTPAQVAMIGTRDVDAEERALLHESKVFVGTMSQIDEQGISTIAQAMLAHVAHCERLHISLDLDSLDPNIAPGVGTPVPGGLTYREAHYLMEMLANTGKVRSMDIVEINPILDNRNETARIAVELTCSLFGKRIL
jgi:arginase